MDPVKFLEFKNNEDKCRSTASNTVPIACANCGSNDYNIQTVQQANFITPLYPGMPSFKLNSDSFKDNFPINPHLFSRPFFQPVFHNSSILSNAFYAHNNFGLMLPNPYRHLSEEHAQGKCESNNKATQVTHSSDYFFNQTQLMQTCSDKMKFQPKDNNAGGDNITKDLEKDSDSKNSEESDTNYLSQCVCNSPLPWLYSPFVLPIISYYILWDSQCSNPKLPPSDYPCNHSQMRQNKKEDGEAKVSETSLKEKKDETNFAESKEKLPKRGKDNLSDDFWMDDKIPKSEWKINNQKNGSSSSFFSISSPDYGEDLFFYTERKSEAKTMSNNCGTEIGVGKSNATYPSEHKEVEESAVRRETNQSDTRYAELDEKVKANPSAPLSADIEEEKEEEEEEDEEEGENEAENNEKDSDVDEDEDDVKYVNNSNEESLVREQVSDSKIQNGYEDETEMSSSEIQFKVRDILSEDIIESVLSKSSQGKEEDHGSEGKKPMSDFREPILKDRAAYKKTIKNFTMADETNSNFYEESKMLASMAAGGDLGGEHCVGYRVDISPPSRQRGNVQNLNKNEKEMKTNEISLKGKELTERHKENNKNDTNPKKTLKGGELENKSKSKTKVERNFKSGIAKLSTNFKAKCTDSNTKNSEDKNCVPEVAKTRRKHNCLATVRTTETNTGNSKFQKSKYSPERQGKNLDSTRENVPLNKVQKQSTKSTDSRQKRKGQQVLAPCKSSI